jgi:hypothetical protein
LEAQKSYETAGVEIFQIGLKLAKLLRFEDLIIIRKWKSLSKKVIQLFVLGGIKVVTV